MNSRRLKMKTHTQCAHFTYKLAYHVERTYSTRSISNVRIYYYLLIHLSHIIPTHEKSLAPLAIESLCCIALPLTVLLQLHVWGILESLGPAPARISHATHTSLFLYTRMCTHLHSSQSHTHTAPLMNTLTWNDQTGNPTRDFLLTAGYSCYICGFHFSLLGDILCCYRTLLPNEKRRDSLAVC